MKKTFGNFYRFWIMAIMIFAMGNSVANGASSDSTIIVDNKTSMFDEIMSDMGASENDTSENNRAEMIRRQRALLDRTDEAQSGATNVGTANTCDAGLRKCMSDKCGTDFTKCANDSTTIWGQKLEACRAKTKCTAHEYTLLAPEILADRDANVRMQYYNAVINCGNRYNDCIFTQCGKTLNKCLSKKDGDNAISKCASIARECREQDSGLAGRVMNVFGDLRTIATERVQRDEKRLYELRDLMRASCNRVGAMFDERTLDCVYTVNFFAGQDNTLMASKKLYAGDSFQCNADWFGIDITTYIENAQRLTRSQKSASAAALGAGVGTAAGLLSSGAIGRAIDTKKAENAVKSVENEKECTESGGTWDGKKCTDKNGKEIEIDGQGEQGGNKPSGGAQGEDNNYDPYEHDFKREDARGEAPKDAQLENDKTGRTCKKYYIDEWCDEYYALYNKEKADKKAANKEQRKQRRQDILDKIGTGIKNTFSKNNQKNLTAQQLQETKQESNDLVKQAISKATGQIP